MVVVKTGSTSVFQVNASKLRRPLDTVDLQKSPDSSERTGAPVLLLSCEGQMDVWELFSVNSWSQPSTSENEEGWKLLTTGTARLLVKDENKETQGSCDVPDGFYPIH